MGWNNDTVSQLTNDERNMAVISHALSFVEGGIIGPVIVYFLKKDESKFVAFHALQSTLWGVGFFALGLLFMVGWFILLLGAIVVGSEAAFMPFFIFPLLLLTGAVYFIFEIIACIRAHRGEWYELPIVGAIARRRIG